MKDHGTRGVKARASCLIVVETGAPWPGAAFWQRDPAIDCIVLAQLPDESPASFSRRVIGRVRGLLEGGSFVQRALLAIGRERSSQRAAARYRISRALIVASGEATELVLAAHERHAPRHDLAALVAVLREGAPGAESIRMETMGERQVTRSAFHASERAA